MDKLNLKLLIITTFFLLVQTAFLKSQVTIGSNQEVLIFHMSSYDLDQNLYQWNDATCKTAGTAYQRVSLTPAIQSSRITGYYNYVYISLYEYLIRMGVFHEADPLL